MLDVLALRLYLVTDHRLPFTAMCETIRAGIAGGVTAVQLRDPLSSGRALLEKALILKALLDPLRIPLLINDRADVAHAAGAAGVHLGQRDLPVAAARSILGPAAMIGLSVSAPDQLASAETAKADYLGVGPIFATATKEDAAPALGLVGLADILARTTLPVVAIGGIDTDNAIRVGATGVRGLAVVSALSQAEDPLSAARMLRQAVTG